MSVPGAGTPDHQSARVSGNDSALPSAKVTVPTPEAVPYAAAPSRPSRPPEPASGTDCPAARALSGVPRAGAGQAKVSPPWLMRAPGVNPAAANAWAE